MSDETLDAASLFADIAELAHIGDLQAEWDETTHNIPPGLSSFELKQSVPVAATPVRQQLPNVWSSTAFDVNGVSASTLQANEVVQSQNALLQAQLRMQQMQSVMQNANHVQNQAQQHLPPPRVVHGPPARIIDGKVHCPWCGERCQTLGGADRSRRKYTFRCMGVQCAE
eukprot:7377981-Prymnesium_polylepis.1